mgnify:CR=1 FL=1
MKLKVIALYKDGKPSDLTLTKEKKIVKYGEEFEIKDAKRANEILNTIFNGKPVVEVVKNDEKKDSKTEK